MGEIKLSPNTLIGRRGDVQFGKTVTRQKKKNTRADE